MLFVLASWMVLAQAEVPVKAPPKDPLLRRAAALFDTLDFENARAAYEQALSVRLANVDEVVEAYLGVGLCASTLGDEATAKKAFLKALALKPDAQLEGVEISPRQRGPFDVARGEAKGRTAIRVEHVPTGTWLPGAVMKLEVSVTNDWQQLVRGARLAYRREGHAAWEEAAVTGPSPYELQVPPQGEGVIEYHLTAIDAQGSPLAQWRSAEVPQQVRVAEAGIASGPPFYQRPWVWVVAGVVVAASVTTGAVVTATQTPDYQVRTRPPP